MSPEISKKLPGPTLPIEFTVLIDTQQFDEIINNRNHPLHKELSDLLREGNSRSKKSSDIFWKSKADNSVAEDAPVPTGGRKYRGKHRSHTRGKGFDAVNRMLPLTTRQRINHDGK